MILPPWGLTYAAETSHPVEECHFGYGDPILLVTKSCDHKWVTEHKSTGKLRGTPELLLRKLAFLCVWIVMDAPTFFLYVSPPIGLECDICPAHCPVRSASLPVVLNVESLKFHQHTDGASSNTARSFHSRVITDDYWSCFTSNILRVSQRTQPSCPW